jgi:hypothetical protein
MNDVFIYPSSLRIPEPITSKSNYPDPGPTSQPQPQLLNSRTISYTHNT